MPVDMLHENGCALSSKCKQEIELWVAELRDRICAEFEDIEPSIKFTRTPWERKQGGGGTMGLMRGDVFEKAGVNISTVFGDVSESMRSLIGPFSDARQFWACGISLVTHTKSPLVPSTHMNTRVICTDNAYWFGGGADLTPTFPYEQDTQDFHDAFREVCEAYRAGSYEEFKNECDQYFFIKHRNEPRGVGGVFYDYLRGNNYDDDFKFMKEIGIKFLEVYSKIVRRNLHRTWTPDEKYQQLIKRGKYTEFNLIYDRGTKFGLVTGANPEAVLMSLPPEAAW